MKLIISSLCGFPGHGTHLLTRGNEVRVLVRNLFVSFYACLIGKLALPNHIRVIRILRLPRTFAASQHATAGDAAFPIAAASVPNTVTDDMFAELRKH